MFSKFTLALVGGVSTFAMPVINRAVDNTQPAGSNPGSLASGAEYLGPQKSNNSCVKRDLGFTGQISGKWYAVFGDTNYCAPGVTDSTSMLATAGGFYGMVRDSISAMTDNVLETHDLHLNSDTPVAYPLQFVPYNSSWGEDESTGFGGTSLCETNATADEGLIFYAVNENVAGIKGAGVAKVKVVNGVPTVIQRFGDSGYWWNASTTPRYGDVAAYRDEKSDYIYALGGAPNSAVGYAMSDYVYQARVKAKDAFNLSQYEYWQGRAAGWSSELPTHFDSTTAVMWNSGQGTIMWSPHYNCYFFVHTAPGGTDILIRTAPSPEGPWSNDVTVYTATVKEFGGMVYAGVSHPYLDPTGKTLTISYTNYPADTEAIRLTFN
ncbi:hypothetical protein EV356DRAFT_515990 [Viridothelium virens]|uniref:DUF4185 domain-containing protein n=1 Tax=Viridothelium virens TaxID=1048519 RepID=A0A6A6H848_VIRVR|nr:hypothetical protein EV356DRAFT_515990 [Viridothelium virens]